MALVFLKLGGSLITDKTRAYTVRPEKLHALAAVIASALQDNPRLRLVLGHGSGSFGHAAAVKYGTHEGVSGPDAWKGFAEVWYQASRLNRFVVDALHQAGLPAVAFSPVASVISINRKVSRWNTHNLRTALRSGLLPVIQGDVIFDNSIGGTILSTEDLFAHLAVKLRPQRILLAGLENGVWADFPVRKTLLTEITPDTYKQHGTGPGTATGADVTGGMNSKVSGMLELLEKIPDLEILIFSGEDPENILNALRGENPGTRLHC